MFLPKHVGTVPKGLSSYPPAPPLRSPFHLQLQPQNKHQLVYISKPIPHFPFPYVCMSIYFLVQERSRHFCLLQKFLGSAVPQSALTVPVVTGPAPLRRVDVAFFTIKNIHITWRDWYGAAMMRNPILVQCPQE